MAHVSSSSLCASAGADVDAGEAADAPAPPTEEAATAPVPAPVPAPPLFSGGPDSTTSSHKFESDDSGADGDNSTPASITRDGRMPNARVAASKTALT